MLNLEAKIQIISAPIALDELKKIAAEGFGDMVKAVVDIERGIMAIGGEMHADEEQVLLASNSNQEDLWGINIYPDAAGENFIQFDSMINIRPRQGNRTRAVEDLSIQEKIKSVVKKLII